MTGTSETAANATEGIGASIYETGKALSNVTRGIY
jgi:predicted small secreted protein